MNRTIFEEETQVGRYLCKRNASQWLQFAEPEYAPLFVHTVALRNARCTVLRVEHRCYLRPDWSAPGQLWCRTKVLLQRVPTTLDKAAAVARKHHANFVEKIRARMPQDHVV